MSPPSEFHEHFQRDEKHPGSSDRAFGLVFATVCALIGGLNYWREHHAWPWWLGAAAIFLVLALALPAVLHPLNVVWTRFGLLLHRIVQPVVMGLLFFGTILPMGLVLRAIGKDPLHRRRDPTAQSYWIKREPPGPAPDSFRNQF